MDKYIIAFLCSQFDYGYGPHSNFVWFHTCILMKVTGSYEVCRLKVMGILCHFQQYVCYKRMGITRRVQLVEQELLTLPEHLSSTQVFRGVCVTRSLVLYVCFVDRYLSFCTFSFAIVLSVLLRYTGSDSPLVSWNSFYIFHQAPNAIFALPLTSYGPEFLAVCTSSPFFDLPLKEKALPIFLAKIYRKSFIKNCYVIHSPSCIVRTHSQVFEKLYHTQKTWIHLTMNWILIALSFLTKVLTVVVPY